MGILTLIHNQIKARIMDSQIYKAKTMSNWIVANRSNLILLSCQAPKEVLLSERGGRAQTAPLQRRTPTASRWRRSSRCQRQRALELQLVALFLGKGLGRNRRLFTRPGTIMRRSPGWAMGTQPAGCKGRQRSQVPLEWPSGQYSIYCPQVIGPQVNIEYIVLQLYWLQIKFKFYSLDSTVQEVEW